VFGIVPLRPETGYGYVHAEKPAVAADAWPVVRFVEKPDAAAAAGYIRSGRYFWNSGIFLWENRTLLALFQQYLPATYRSLRELAPLIGRSGKAVELRSRFGELQRISIDYGILEKAHGLRLVPADFAWDDIGNWSALERALPADAWGNVTRGPHATVDSRGCIIYSDAGTVATFGLSDIVVVQANGNVLVCPKALAPELKRMVTALGPENTRTHNT
jgi:mannose-1-phosphate guanylyltransferase